MKRKRKPKPIKAKEFPYVIAALTKHFEQVKR